MKLHLLLLASLFNLSSAGFMVELTGTLAEEACTGEEYADFKYCVNQSTASDPFLTESTDLVDEAFVTQSTDLVDEALVTQSTDLVDEALVTQPTDLVDDQDDQDDQGNDRKLNWCAGCTGGAPRGTFCFTVCGGRRRLEEAADTPNLRRVQEGKYAEYQGGSYTGNGEAKQIAKEIIECLVGSSTHHPCLGSTDNMTLTVTL
jgi:hypothetical protein